MLPGIGHFTILDPGDVTPEDAGNNFFFDGPSSVGKKRAEEGVRLLRELNDGVEGVARVGKVEEFLGDEEGEGWLKGFSLIIAHNLETSTLDRLAGLLWEADMSPILVTVDSTGFLAEFSIQFHEHDSKRPLRLSLSERR